MAASFIPWHLHVIEGKMKVKLNPQHTTPLCVMKMVVTQETIIADCNLTEIITYFLFLYNLKL